MSTSSSSSTSTVSRQPTHRDIADTLSDRARLAATSLTQRAAEINQRHEAGTPLDTDELQDLSRSLLNVCPKTHQLDLDQLHSWWQSAAHLSHKDWARTEEKARQLQSLLIPDGLADDNTVARQLAERVLQEGNWAGAVAHAHHQSHAKDAPPPPSSWAVLVTGVNGIRKTTSLYQPWFGNLLHEAMVAPSISQQDNNTAIVAPEQLPTGRNSFFRQLDHMICTICNEDFGLLYALTAQEWPAPVRKTAQRPPPENDDGSDDAAPPPPAALIEAYSNLKAALFARYRMYSECLGVCLLQQAQASRLNCLMETSGKDVAMFHYVDHVFRASKHYRKLALQFEINDLQFAKTSVDARMVDEMRAGVAARNVWDVIYANAGGPYGSQVLDSVQAAAKAVWQQDILSGKAATDWYKATIRITAHHDQPWTAQAVRPDGTLGTMYEFVDRR